MGIQIPESYRREDHKAETCQVTVVTWPNHARGFIGQAILSPNECRVAFIYGKKWMDAPLHVGDSGFYVCYREFRELEE